MLKHKRSRTHIHTHTRTHTHTHARNRTHTRTRQVPANVAVAEGMESLEERYRLHREFFGSLPAEWGITDLDSEELVTAYFELVYRA